MQTESDRIRREQGRAQASGATPPKQSSAKNGKTEDLSWLKFESVDDLPDQDLPEIIQGLLRASEKLGITAGSKSFKTWLLLYLAYCLANGLPFLDFPTKAVKVAIFDFELSRRAIKRRLKLIQKQLCGQGDFSNLRICAMRGKTRKFYKNIKAVQKLVITEGVEVVIIDPVYKFLLGKDESANGQVADMLEGLTEFCMEANVAIVYVHHHSKGNQSERDAQDRSSGAGAWSRDPDCLFDLAKHTAWTDSDPIFTAEFILRDFPAVQKFVVRWQWPLLVRDTTGLDPDDLKPIKKPGRPKKDLGAEILAILRAEDSNGGTTAKILADSTLVTHRTMQRRLKELLPAKIVKSVLLTDGYQLSLDERNRFEDFKKKSGP